MLSSRSLRVAATLGPAVIILVFGVVAHDALGDVRRSGAAVQRGLRVQTALQKVVARLADAETAQRGYLLTGEPRYLQPLDGAHTDVAVALAALDRLVVDSAQRERLNALAPAARRRLAQVEGLLPRLDRGKALMDSVRARVGEMERAELAMLAERSARARRDARFAAALLLSGALLAAALAALANLLFARHAAAHHRDARELEERNRRLEDQAVELEESNAMLQAQTTDLEAQAEELQAQTAELEESSESLRRQEARFRALIENAWDVVTVLDGEGRRLYQSPSAERVLGHTPEELTGVDAFALAHPDDADAVRAMFAEVAGEAGARRVVECRSRHADGSWRTLESTGHNLLHDPAVGGIVVNSRDVTESRQVQDALRQTEEQLRQAQKMEAVGRLAGGIAHDFNNLLTVIGANASMLLQDAPEASQEREDLQEIRSAADRAAGLTRQLLAFSRKQIIQPCVLDLNTVVGDTQKMLSRVIGEDVRLQTALEPRLRPVLADAGQMEQIILNLAVNARDAMPGGGTLTVETRTATVAEHAAPLYPGAEPGDQAVVLTVRDTGHGMDGETKARIFEPFFTTKGPGQGTGLGLSTVYGIVQQSGGDIRVRSEPGRGTSFQIYLPCARASVLPAADDTRAPLPAAAASETILLVEDEPAVRRLGRRILERGGYAVVEAGSAAAALDLADRHPGPIHLLLTDVVMPGMSGKALADRLGGRMPRLRVLFTSGYTDDAIVQHGVLEPGIAFLEKPFTPDVLLRRVREVLGTPAEAAPAVA
jgi:PAS domain S-box-containing protein